MPDSDPAREVHLGIKTGAFYGQDNLVFTLAAQRHQITVCSLDYDFTVALSNLQTMLELLD